jgi:hypothetical protein
MDIRELDLRLKTFDELKWDIYQLEFKFSRPYRNDKQKLLIRKQIDTMKELQITAKIKELMCKANHPSRSSEQRLELREEIQKLQNKAVKK